METNWYVGTHYPAGRNLFFVWDAEGSWQDGAEVRLGGRPKGEGAPFPNVVKLVFDALSENPDFQMVFADRLYLHLFNDGALTETNAAALWSEVTGEIEDAIVAESARWGDVRFDSPITLADWLCTLSWVSVRDKRPGNVAKCGKPANQPHPHPPWSR